MQFTSIFLIFNLIVFHIDTSYLLIKYSIEINTKKFEC